MRKLTDLVILVAILALPVLLAAAIPSLASPAPLAAGVGEAGGPPGKVAFADLKCSICHSIESQGIERKSKSEKTKGPDLSTVGAAHDADWFGKFLRKEVANADGKKHGKDFKGTPEQLQQIAQFLASLKTK
jgi:mono/diheme cytochrome c family protein